MHLIPLLILIAVVLCLAIFVSPNLPNLRDAGTIQTRALPNGAATVYSSGLNLGSLTVYGSRSGQEFIVNAPAMNATQMPDGKTMKYSIMVDDVLPIDGSSIVLLLDLITQTGAGGVGCAAAEKRFRIPSDCLAIIGLRAIASASGDATGVDATLQPVF